MIDSTTQAQSGDDDMGGDNVAVSMEESKMDDFFQEVVLMVMVMVMVMIMVVMVMVVTDHVKTLNLNSRHPGLSDVD